MNKKTVFEIVDNKTGELIETFSYSIRVRLRPVDIEKYKKTHVLLNRLEG